MPSVITSATLNKSINRLEALAAANSSRVNADCVAMCAKGLRSFLQGIEGNEKYIVTTLPIYEFFRAHLSDLLLRVENGGAADFDALSELCFALFEEMAVLTREKYLRAGGNVTPVEEEVMRYFEQSGLWRINDGTLVSEYYFVRLPMAVLRSGTHAWGENCANAFSITAAKVFESGPGAP